MKIEIKNCSWVDVETHDYRTFYITACGDNGNQIVLTDISRKYLEQLHAEIAIMLKKK